jgi:hypothetical protein
VYHLTTFFTLKWLIQEFFARIPVYDPLFDVPDLSPDLLPAITPALVSLEGLGFYPQEGSGFLKRPQGHGVFPSGLSEPLSSPRTGLYCRVILAGKEGIYSLLGEPIDTSPLLGRDIAFLGILEDLFLGELEILGHLLRGHLHGIGRFIKAPYLFGP